MPGALLLIRKGITTNGSTVAPRQTAVRDGVTLQCETACQPPGLCDTPGVNPDLCDNGGSCANSGGCTSRRGGGGSPPAKLPSQVKTPAAKLPNCPGETAQKIASFVMNANDALKIA